MAAAFGDQVGVACPVAHVLCRYSQQVRDDLREAGLVPLADCLRPGGESDLAVIVTGSYLGSYHRLGPQALGTRTTFGPHYVEQFGRERLLSTPVHVTELDWGGIQLDLVEEPWTASMEDLVGAWRRGMEHLAPAGIFAEVQIDEERKRIRYLRKGPNVVIGGVLPKES